MMSRMWIQKNSNQMMNQNKGFTLIEIIMVIVILGIVSSIAAPMIYEASQSASQQYKMTDVLDDARIALERMTREIRMVRSATAADLSIGASTLTFTDVTASVITYTLSGSNLTRNGQILATHVTSLIFSYQDANGNTTAVVTQVRYITITMVISESGYTTNLKEVVALYDV
ncbi:MAG TPA: hypothetical protein DIC51_05215 [Coxiellaceae bacterium]|nr:hypothetical protein [Coxiellaceae bacterium]